MKPRKALSGSGGILGGVIWKQLLLFFFPILLGSFFQQMYNTVDAIVVGQKVGKEALAAVGGTTGALVALLFGFFIGLASGATVVISQLFGSGDKEGVSRATHTAAAMALLFGAVLTVVGVCFSETMLGWMSTPEDVMKQAAPYLRVYFVGMIPSLIYNIGTGILRAVGDSRRPTLYLIAACVTNIVLDILFVYVLEMGVRGAAWATVASQTVSAVLTVRALMLEKSAIHLDLNRIRFHGPLLRDILRIGFPTALQSVMYSLSNVIIQSAVNSFDTDVIAGWTAYGKIDFIYWMTVSAFGVALTTFAGQNFGARQYDRVKQSVRVCLGMTAGSTVVLSAFLLVFGRPLYHLFTQDEGVINEAVYQLNVLVPTYLTYICIELLSGALRGCGDTLIPTAMTLVGVCVLRLIWIWGVLPDHHSMLTVMLSYPITWIVTSAMFIIYYAKGNWLRRCIARQAG